MESRIDLLKNWHQKAEIVYERLVDDESRFLFEKRVEYMFDPNLDGWIECIGGYYADWRMVNNFFNANANRIMIYGAGHEGIINLHILRCCGITPVAICDSFIKGHSSIEGIPHMNVEEAVKQYPDTYFLIASFQYRHELYANLLSLGVQKEQIHVPMLRYPFAERGWQYLDVFSPKDKEIIIDAGAWNGNTVDDFLIWGKESIRKIYAVEPLNSMTDFMKNKYKRNDRVEIVEYAAWNKAEMLNFQGAGTSSMVREEGTVLVKGNTIDNILNGKEATFIKMDIEGSEWRALRGSEKTIRQYRPRLAISVYHKPNDIVELGKYILELVPEYKLYIRQYAMDNHETVMYATV